MEKCVSESNRNCEENGCYLSPHSVGYKFKNTNEAKNVFGGQSILIVNPASKNFDRWLEPKFGRIACIIEQYEFGDEELMLYEQNCYYAFGEITVLEKLNQNSQNAVPKLTFRCEKDIYERYWKCKTCGYFVKRNDVELICKCGLSFMKTAKFNCPVQHANVPMKKEKLCINNGINDKSDEQKAFFQKKSKKFLENTHTILVFGHEGSGKSAVINAVINYMMFPSLKEALIKPITVPIAFMFTFNGEKHFRMERNAEKSIITSSKYPKITIIEHEYESNVYRFIDTPEISASQNFAFAIQDSLTYLHPFDGIWIVMPGNVKLNASETWLHPILKMIPKKLFPRINYVFTDIPKSGNAVDHFQTILKCLPTLKGIVPSPDNMFYVSNDSLKFLYTFKTEINNLTKVSIYEKIWAHSKSEMFRLLEKSRLSYIDDNERTKLSFLIDLQYLFNAIRGKVNNDTLMPLIQLLEKEYLFTEFNVNKFTKNSSPSYREVLQSICKIKSEIIFKYPCEILDTFIEKYNDKFTSV
uniref:G domain-containing protein n=1 Tax=Panagrolaimus sp. ES5 TaxID=591445 RepID=A0AC34FEL4_9BILA